jgi:hypothetical protein
MVNAAVVQGRIMALPGVIRHSGICPTFASTIGGSASCSNACGDWAEDRKMLLHFGIHAIHGVISRRHSSGFIFDEAKA